MLRTMMLVTGETKIRQKRFDLTRSPKMTIELNNDSQTILNFFGIFHILLSTLRRTCTGFKRLHRKTVDRF